MSVLFSFLSPHISSPTRGRNLNQWLKNGCVSFSPFAVYFAGRIISQLFMCHSYISEPLLELLLTVNATLITAIYILWLLAASTPFDGLIQLCSKYFLPAALCTNCILNENWIGADSARSSKWHLWVRLTASVSWAQESPKAHCDCRPCLSSRSLFSSLAVPVLM